MASLLLLSVTSFKVYGMSVSIWTVFKWLSEKLMLFKRGNLDNSIGVSSLIMQFAEITDILLNSRLYKESIVTLLRLFRELRGESRI